MKNTKLMFRVKLGMALALLLCLADLPYGFYVLIRFAAMVVFAVMAYQYYQAKNNVWMVTFGALALLFQPLVKISLDRETWNVVDLVVAVLLLYLLWKERK